jgi:hypothetical protein
MRGVQFGQPVYSVGLLADGNDLAFRISEPLTFPEDYKQLLSREQITRYVRAYLFTGQLLHYHWNHSSMKLCAGRCFYFVARLSCPA